jgi:hypothetical protein
MKNQESKHEHLTKFVFPMKSNQPQTSQPRPFIKLVHIFEYKEDFFQTSSNHPQPILTGEERFFVRVLLLEILDLANQPYVQEPVPRRVKQSSLSGFHIKP